MWSHDRLCFTGLEAGLWPRLLTQYWLEEEAPTKSLSSFLSPFLSIFSPFSEPLGPFPPCFSATLLWQTARDCITSAFSFDTSSLIDCMSGKHKVCVWIQVKAHKFSRFRLETLAAIPKRTVVMFFSVYEHVFSTCFSGV